MRLAILVALAGCAGINRPLPADPAVEIGNVDGAPIAAAPVVATYNVHGSSAGAIAAALEADRQLARAAILLVQEIEHHPDRESVAAKLAARLGMAHAYAPGYGLAGGGSHGVAILARAPLRDVAVIELPRHHTVFNSGRRVALAATVDLGGRAARIYSVHLDNRINPADRLDQLAPVLADAERHRGPAIIGGDFNTSPFCWIGHVVPVPCWAQGRALDRLLRRAGFATPTATAGATSRYLGMRLDSVFVRDLEVARADVADVWLSDHFPVVVTLR